jgi:hypothetical protein
MEDRMKLVYGVVGVAAAIAAVVVGILGMPDVMLISALLAAALLLAANSDRIAKVRAGLTGFEAETRAVIDEARATIEQVRLVGKLAAQANLTHITWANRWGGMSYEDKERTRSHSINALRQLGATDADIDEALRDWHMITRFDYAHHLLGGSTVPEIVMKDGALMQEWKALRDGGVQKIPSPDTLQTFLGKVGLLDGDRAELLEDYRFYVLNKAHRRAAVWKALVDRNQ